MNARDRGTADSHLIRYRPDIDGLRAVAVLSVVSFHLSKTALPGGYLGVDMFFVLSGYLITAIIWQEMQEDRFSIVRFYDRRIRRLMPGLLLLLFVATLASAALLLPRDLAGYGKSLLATLVFSANIYFWRDTDYFSAAAELKPLLHIWSLGVEEQFYIFFPLMLVVLASWRPRRALHAVALLTVASLAADIAALLIGGSMATLAFFMLPARAWELGIGAVVALTPPSHAPRAAGAALAGAAGIMLVAIGLAVPLDSIRFMPVAVPAAVGTALLILSGQHDLPMANRILRLRPLVFVGVISYSLYLWHWPIIVLGQYYLVRSFTVPEMAGALGLMTACAIGSWWWVERPFRDKRMPIRRVRFTAAAGVVCMGLAAAVLLETGGLPGRLSAEAAMLNQAVETNYRCSIPDYLRFGASHACAMNLPSRKAADADVVLLGNSHAQMYAPLWTSILSARGWTSVLVPSSGCLPTVLVNISRECIATARQNLDAVSALPHAHIVIVGLNWWHAPGELVDAAGGPADNDHGRALQAALDDLIDRLRGAEKQVVVIGPIAEPGWPIASTLSRQAAFGRPVDRPTFTSTAIFERQFQPLIRHFESRGDIGFARPDKVQCPDDRCYYVLDGRALFADTTHIAAAELPRFRATFEEALPLPAEK